MLNKNTFGTKMNKYKRFTLKLLTLFIIVFALDFACGKLLQYFYFKQSSGWNYRTTYAMENTTDSLLIFGSSRAVQQYHPEILQDRLNLSYYNCGRDGNFMLYNYAVLKSVLKRHKPKMIIFDFIKGQFKENPSEYERLAILLPYYKTHPEIREVVNRRSEFEKFKLLSNTYPYNSTMFNTLIGNMEFNKKRHNDIKGYVIFDNVWDRPLKTVTQPEKYDFDTVFLNTYESFIKDCVDANVKLYIVCSPYYELSPFTDTSIALGKSIAQKYKVDFIDLSKDTFLIKQPALFSDSMHLNDDGAKIFSNIVADEIGKINSSGSNALQANN
ncbi:MAG: hypothetical protein QM791_08260 [Ferruginibacter sp.]